MNIAFFDSVFLLYHYVLTKVVNKFSHTELRLAWRMNDIFKYICFDIFKASRLYDFFIVHYINRKNTLFVFEALMSLI